jgi:hypothetical protein
MKSLFVDILLFVIVYVVFHITLLPSIPGGDSGELLGNSCVFGISHPPGYPLFSMASYFVGKLLPINIPRMYLDNDQAGWFNVVVDMNPTYAWKVNNMCAIFASFTVVLISKCSNIISKLLSSDNDNKNSNVSNVTGAILFAFSPLAWEYSSQSAEVFAMNNFICANVIYFTCKIIVYVNRHKQYELLCTTNTNTDTNKGNSNGSSDSNNNSNNILYYIYLGALFSGFAFSNQHASLLFLIILIPSIVLITYNILKINKKLLLLFFGSLFWFFIGISPYFLQIYYANKYPQTRGSWGNLTNINGIIKHIFRAEYGTFKLGADVTGSAGFIERLWLYMIHTSVETSHIVLPLFLLSMLFSRSFMTTSTVVVEKVDEISDKIGEKKTKPSTPTPTLKSKLTTTDKEKGKGKHAKQGGKGKKDAKKDKVKGKDDDDDDDDEFADPAEKAKTHAKSKLKSKLKSKSNTDDDYDEEEKKTTEKENQTGSGSGSGSLKERFLNSNLSTKSFSLSSSISSYYGRLLYNLLWSTWFFYVIVWHGVLSNLPLDAPMPYIVHARFWIQPHIILCILAGVGAHSLLKYIQSFFYVQPTPSATNTNTNTHTNTHTRDMIEISVIILLYSFLVSSRYTVMDRSKTGWIMHKYGEAILDTLPRNSLLLSHTDLDWNPTRYLRECEHHRQDYYYEGSSSSKNMNDDYSHAYVSKLNKKTMKKRYRPRPDVTHMNFQMIAYPWFKEMQQSLYPHVVFPKVDFAGISTNKASEGNAILITNTVVGNGASTFTPQSVLDTLDYDSIENLIYNNNHNILNENALKYDSDENPNPTNSNRGDVYKTKANHSFHGGIYIDMQSVHDVEIEEAGKWRGLILLPWGLLYRVLGQTRDIRDMEVLHISSYHQLQIVQNKLKLYNYDYLNINSTDSSNDILFQQYPSGSWEFAALSVLNDAQMQLGLNFLTYCIELQKNADLNLLPILVDRLYTSAILLENSHLMANKYNAISSSKSDLHKNTAMAWMRMQGIIGIALSFKEQLIKEINSSPDKLLLKNILPHNKKKLLDEIITDENYIEILKKGTSIINSFLYVYPNDKDKGAFQATIDQMAKALAKYSNNGNDVPPSSSPGQNQNQNQETKTKSKTKTKKSMKKGPVGVSS